MSATDGAANRRPDMSVLVITWSFSAAFLWLIGIVAAVIFAYPFSPGYQGTSLEVGDVFGMIVGTLFLLGCTSLAIASGIGVLGGKRWGRMTGIVNAVFSLFLVPVGTVVGPLVLIYLLKPDVREYFGGVP